ncbi:MAG: chaperone modulator CbpM [Chitinophagaceae bacterium]
MPAEEMIPASEFCIHHHIELSFIDSLQQSGLLQISRVEDQVFVPLSQMQQLEKLVRLYYEMDINLEGIETISHLLQRMNDMQRQITDLNNRLQIYEDF